MDVKNRATIDDPFDSTKSYEIRVVDHGQGIKRVQVTEENERNWKSFQITNYKRKECQWRRNPEELDESIRRIVEFFGYHITNVPLDKKYGLYNNLNHIREALREIDDQTDDVDIITKSALKWSDESIESLQKLEILRNNLTEVQYEVVAYKANMRSKEMPSGQITIDMTNYGHGITSTSLKSLVYLMIAYAQHDGYIEKNILDESIVKDLIGGEK